MIFKFFVIVVLGGVLTSTITFAQKVEIDTSAFSGPRRPPSDLWYDSTFTRHLNLTKLKLNPPAGFTSVAISKADEGKFYNARGFKVATFWKVIISKNNNIAIGFLIVAPDTHSYGTKLDLINNVKAPFGVLADTNQPFRELGKAELSPSGATYGVEFITKNPKPFMNTFTHHQFVSLASENFDVFMVYFSTNPKLIDFYRKNNPDIIERL
ncbi:MAG: hypothetical protein V4687_15055 [Bacteroidota bacterium]